MLLLLTRSPLVLHGLEDRAADPIRKYAISQGGTRIRIDHSRANRFDSVSLALEDDRTHGRGRRWIAPASEEVLRAEGHDRNILPTA